MVLVLLLVMLLEVVEVLVMVVEGGIIGAVASSVVGYSTLAQSPGFDTQDYKHSPWLA